MPAAEDDQGGIVQKGVGNAGEGVGKPRAGRDQAYAGLVFIDRPGVSHHGGGLFVPDVDGFDIVGVQSVQKIFDVAARKGEDHFHLFHILHVFGRDVSTVYLCHHVLLES